MVPLWVNGWGPLFSNIRNSKSALNDSGWNATNTYLTVLPGFGGVRTLNCHRQMTCSNPKGLILPVHTLFTVYAFPCVLGAMLRYRLELNGALPLWVEEVGAPTNSSRYNGRNSH
jgi:hypothetical protein